VRRVAPFAFEQRGYSAESGSGELVEGRGYELRDERARPVRWDDSRLAAAGITIHNFYVPAGGDIADPGLNEKFRHKLDFMAEMRSWGGRAKPTSQPAILVGDLNVAPLEHDVWSHKQLLDVVSHTPVETAALEELRQEAEWIDAMRVLCPEPEKIYSWWSYRSPDWAAADKGRRLDHIWLSKGMQDTIRSIDVTRATRGWDRPSDHAPVTAVLEL